MIPLLNDTNDVLHDFEEWHCDKDVTDKKIGHIFEFVEVSSFAAVLSSNFKKSIIFIKIEGKGVTENELRDLLGHVDFQGEWYFRGNYLKELVQSIKSISTVHLVSDTVDVASDKIHEWFVEFDENHTINKDVCTTILSS